MHRIFRRTAPSWGGLILTLIGVIGGGVSIPAQEPTPQPTPLIVPVNNTIRLQMSKKQKIKTVTNPKENVVSLRTLEGDPTTILITGQQDGVTRIELEDAEGTKESYEVIVQPDIDYLRAQLRRALPTANITIIPLSTVPPPGKVLISGTVMHDGDVAVVRGLVQSLGFQYIDGMRVSGVQQVQLDVVIAQVNRSDLRNLTFNFITSTHNYAMSSTIGGATSVGTGGTGVFPPTFGAGSAMVGSAPASTNLLLGIVHSAWALEGFLEALRANGLAKLLAEPRLLTMSGRPASFLVGGLQAVPQTGQFGGTGVSFQQFGTMLSFLPIVMGNGKIYLEVSPSVSTLDQANGLTNFAGTNVPGRDINFVSTSVELETGQTLAIGGLIQRQTQAIRNAVPWLSDLPYLGALFRNIQYQETEQEVLVLVTPWLVDAESCNQRPKVVPGEETRRPDNFELFLEGILEAPRGPRQVYQNRRYVAPWKNSPSATQFPCVGRRNCVSGQDGCGTQKCGCTTPAGEQTRPFGETAPLDAPPASPLSPSSPPAPLDAPLQPVPSEARSTPPAAAVDPPATTPETKGEN